MNYTKQSWYYIADFYKEVTNIKREINLELFVSSYLVFLPHNKLLIIATSDHTAATTCSYMFDTGIDTSQLSVPVIALNSMGIMGDYNSCDGVRAQLARYITPAKKFYGEPTDHKNSKNIALSAVKREERKVLNPVTDEYEYGDQYFLNVIETGVEYEPVYQKDIIELAPFVPAAYNLPESCLQNIIDYTKRDKTPPAASSSSRSAGRSAGRSAAEKAKKEVKKPSKNGGQLDAGKGELLFTCQRGKVYISEIERRFLVVPSDITDDITAELKKLGFSFFASRKLFRHSLKLSGQKAVREAVKLLGGVKG